jgi:hypothetical protein
MLATNHFQPLQPLVNYTTVPTQASNEIYVAETNHPESTAFLIRNNLIVKFDFPVDNASDVKKPIFHV